MPSRMKQLAVVQFFTWSALFSMWIFFAPAVARNILGATDTNSELYKQGINLANSCFATYNLTAFFAAMAFLWLGRKASAKYIHFGSLLLGGLGLASLCLPANLLLGEIIGVDFSMFRILGHPVGISISGITLAFIGVGIAWASILSMPYAMLSGALPADRIGVYMGIFNLFIVIPQILVALILSRVMEQFPQVNRLTAVVAGGVCMIIAALVTLRVKDSAEPKTA
jgi:maltose/moltooligosaccharide transporter